MAIVCLFAAKKHYGLVISNYMAISNHIHLLVMDDGGDELASEY
jgi:hypothetical protein